MPQNPLQSNVAVYAGARVPLNTDASGNLLVSVDGTVTVNPNPDDASSVKNITAATVVKATPGTALVVSVVVAGSAAGFVHDAATTGTAAASNAIAVTPAAVGTQILRFPCSAGIVVAPGTGQTIAIAYV